MNTTAFAASGDVSIAWDEQGSGEPVLLVQGLGYTRPGWSRVPSLLAERFRVLAFDNRGMGESGHGTPPYSVPQLGADAVAVLDAAGTERAHVVGVSLGGMIAQEVALAYPERVDRLVLGCTTPGGPRSYPMPDRSVRAFAEFAQLPPEEGLRRLVLNALADGTAEARPELVEEVYRYRLANRPDPTAWQAQATAAVGFDALDRLGSIAAPTLVLTGTADTVVDARNSELLAAAIPGARLVTFEGAGHIFFWEQPEHFARTIASFLGEPE
jgi:pimeloyl-ACP methyl ester carboxylesterase